MKGCFSQTMEHGRPKGEETESFAD